MSGEVVIVWDFTAQQTRFVTRAHAGLNLPAGWVQFDGAEGRRDGGSSLDVASNSLTIGDSSLAIVDRDQSITAWLKQYDSTLSGARVTRRVGYFGDDESTYLVTEWAFSDYQVDGRGGGGYELRLDNVLKPMTRGLFEDFDGDTYRLDPTTYPINLGPAATTITLEESPKGVWREPGHCALYDTRERWIELVAYQSIGGAGNKDLLNCTRRKFNVGYQAGSQTAHTFDQDKTDVFQVWARRGNPLDVMLELLTTTSAGGNGAYDQADGDGLGIDVSLINVSAIEAIRDSYWPQPTWGGFNGEELQSGTAVLFIEKDPIDDVKDWIERHILRPFALFPTVDAQERFSVEVMFRVPPDEVELGAEWMIDDFRADGWKRNLPSRVNNLSLLADWDPSQGEHTYRRSWQEATSISRYGKAKAIEIQSRGGRTGRHGSPDYGSAQDLEKAASKIFLEAANPWTTLKLRAFMKFRDRALATLLRVTLPAVPDLSQGTRGKNALLLITRKRIDWQKMLVEFGVRIRRPILRPAFVAPDSVASSYSAASASDREYCYLTPGESGQFDNGDEAYTVVT